MPVNDIKSGNGSGDILLSVVLPCYNEEEKIGSLLQDIQHYLEQQDFNAEIIVVDDRSTDSTHKILNQFCKSHPIGILRNETNSGKGYCVKRGVMASRGKYILFMDADRAYSISALYDFLTPLLRGECDVVLGNRRIHRSRFVLSPKYLPYIYLRHLLGQIFSVLSRWIVLPRYTDTQCGYKCFSRKAGVRIFELQRTKGFCFDVEFLFLAEKLGYRCMEVPVIFHYDGEPSSVRLFPHSLYYLLDLIRIRFNDSMGRYNVKKTE